MTKQTTPGSSRLRSAGKPGGITGLALGVLAVLLVLPGYALSRLAPTVDWRWWVGVPLALSLVTFLLYRSDKRRAEAGAWRIPESTLHLAALLGGWPGAWLAQRQYRHKTAKLSFQAVFWLTVLAHEFTAVDSLLHWQLTREAYRFIRSAIA